jgi:hypothetical protein
MDTFILKKVYHSFYLLHEIIIFLNILFIEYKHSYFLHKIIFKREMFNKLFDNMSCYLHVFIFSFMCPYL